MAAKFNADTFVHDQLKLIQLERSAEIEEVTTSRKTRNIKELEKQGICLSKLFVASQCTGLFGKHLLTLQQKSQHHQLKKSSKAHSDENKTSSRETVSANCFTNGDIVGLQLSTSDLKEDNIASGVVTRASENAITVAFDDAIEVLPSILYRLTKLCNDVTYRRLKEALHALKSGKKDGHLKNILFHSTAINLPLSLVKDEEFHPFDQTLNESQVKAVKFALNQREVAVIHGPPGTGKTTTVIEIIKQAVRKFNLKVLACAPSNVAVDNLVAKLVGEKIKIVRLGHPARVYPHLQKFSLDAALMNSDSAEVVRGVRTDISETLIKLKKSKNDGEARKYKNELKFLKKELRERENKALKSVLSSANVILSTTTSSSAEGPLKHLPDDHFDLIIIDEAAQAMEASCWIALPHANKCILAGDHQQLPPTIISKDAAKKGLEITLMERVIKEFGDSVVRMLTTQYRMHQDIMKWPSRQLYDDKLTADQSVASHLLAHLPGVEANENTSLPLLFVDTAGCFMYELPHEADESKGNEWEVGIVESHVDALIGSGVKQEDVGIITPYNLQVELLRESLSSKYPNMEIRSVDGFQGREKEAIVISLVRSNDKGEVGFLREDRRLNVAITRARRHLAVVGDSETISHHDFLKSFFEYVVENGEVRSVESYTKTSLDVKQDNKADEQTELMMKDFGMLNRVKRGTKYDGGEDVDRGAKSKRLNKFGKGELTNQAFECQTTRNTEDDKKSDTKVKRRTKKDLEKMIADFISDETEQELEFDSSLDAKGRFRVHELAEKFGLLHKSTGEGVGRKICVGKVLKKEEIQEEKTKEEVTTETPSVAICENCEKKIPELNLELHILRCKRNIITEVKQSKTRKEHTNDAKFSSQKRKNLAKNKGKNKMDKENEDIDELIAEFTNQDSKCRHDKCKASVLTLGQRCKFCGKTYCLKHGLAEVHGCGEAAKIDARAKARQQYETRSNKPLNEVKKNQVKRKLNKKITEMESSRTRAKEKHTEK